MKNNLVNFHPSHHLIKDSIIIIKNINNNTIAIKRIKLINNNIYLKKIIIYNINNKIQFLIISIKIINKIKC